MKRVKEHLDADTFDIVQRSEAEEVTKKAIIEWISNHSEEPGLTSKISLWVTPEKSCKPGNTYVNPKAHKPEKT